MIQVLDKYGNTSTDDGKILIYDKFGHIKRVTSGATPIGPAGGDLSGTYPNPSVVWNNGTSTYDLLYYPLSSNPAGYLTTAVTSVGMTVPSAFNVTPSTITSTGTFAITGAGVASQYIRGDGTLANFPTSTGGGSSVNYYLNGSVSQGVFGGTTYYQMSRTPILGAGTNFIRTNGAGNGYIASFITDAGDPSFLNIPGGNWNVEFYFQSSSTGGSPQFYAELYKVSATNVFSFIANGSANPEGITNGTNVDQYFTSIPVPQTSLLLTDRLAIRIYVITSGKTITLHTENGNLCEILTTFTTGLTALNGLTAQVQNFAVGTTGTDFNISSVTATHTFNLPTASATNRGALSSADWTTFNNKTRAFASGIDGSTVANTTTITATYTQLIPAGTFVAGDVVDLLYRVVTATLTKAQISGLYIYISTTNVAPGSAVSGATQLAIWNSTAGIRTAEMTRTIAVKGSTTRVPSVSVSASSDATLTGTAALLTIDWTVNQYFIFAIGHTVASATENFTGDCYIIRKN